jgi:hypothetical protein
MVARFGIVSAVNRENIVGNPLIGRLCPVEKVVDE